MAFSHGFLFPQSTQVIAHLCTAVSHPARLTMLSKIIDANDWVQRSTVVDKIPLTDVSISQHLRKLRVMGFVESRNVGNTTEYRIAPAAQACGQLFKDILKAASKQIDHLTRTTLLRQLQLSSPKETEE